MSNEGMIHIIQIKLIKPKNLNTYYHNKCYQLAFTGLIGILYYSFVYLKDQNELKIITGCIRLQLAGINNKPAA